MRTVSRNRAFILAAATLFATAGAAAQTTAGQHEQHHAQPNQGFRYDRQAETTVRGTIDSVSQQREERLGKGTHITVRGDDGRIHSVYLGPENFLTQRQLQLRRGERVELSASPTTIENRQVWLAREVTKDGRTVALRTAEGLPHWQAAADRVVSDPMYDRGSETTVRGEVESVILRTRTGADDEWQQQAAIRTDEGQLVFVHFGPRDYMKDQDFKVRQGDRIEVTGSRARVGTEDVLLARQVTAGGRNFALRTAEGHPQWSQTGADREMTHYPMAHREAAEWPQVEDRAMAERMETGMRYDRQRETTIRGTVQDFRVHDRPGAPASSHVTIRTDDGRTVTALMGPAQHLEQHGVQLRQGAQVSVTGSRMEFEGRDTIIARQVQSEGRTVTVRDQAGQPQWQVEREHQMHQERR